MKRFWFKYSSRGTRNQFFWPLVLVQLSTTESSLERQFLCDTGAVTSWAGMIEFARLFPKEYEQVKDNLPATEILDASGNPLCGIRKSVQVCISSITEPTERIYFTENIYFGKVKFNLLGQTAFEQIGGHFHNFPSSGRKFALFTNNLAPKI